MRFNIVFAIINTIFSVCIMCIYDHVCMYVCMYVCMPVCKKATCGNIAVCHPLKINQVYRKNIMKTTARWQFLIRSFCSYTQMAHLYRLRPVTWR